MEELFSFPQPDQTRQDNLRRVLLAKHEALFLKPKTSWWTILRTSLTVPLYTALVLSLSFSTVVGVKAYSSPAAEIMGTTYGLGARISFALAEVSSDLSLTPAPALPGLSVEETRTLRNATGSTKNTLLSKVARTLPEEKTSTLGALLNQSSTTVKKEVSSTVRATWNKQGLLLTWDEQMLSNGAFPKAYTVEVSRGDELRQFLARTQHTSFTDTLASPHTVHAYTITILDWNNLPLTPPLRLKTTAISGAPVPDEALPQTPQDSTTTPKTPTAPVEDFRDVQQPLLDLRLGLQSSVASVKSFSLRWQKPSTPGVSGYTIYRDNFKRNVGIIHTTSFEDFDVVPGKSYQYQVRAVDATGDEIGKSEKITMKFPDQAPTPTGLSVQLHGKTATVSWSPVDTPSLSGYILTRKDADSGNEIVIYKGAATTFIDTSIAPDHVYFYALQATLTSGITSNKSKGISLSVPSE